MTARPFEPIHITTAGPPRTLPLDRLERDANGVPFERCLIDGQEVVVHFDDIPAVDRTVVDGVPCTTARRTMIDLATDVAAADLDRMVLQCLERGLFTVDDALDRLAKADMLRRPGGPLVVHALARCLR